MELTETDDYVIYCDILIFKPKFNKPTDEYAELIQNYTQIIFSNYIDLEILLKTNNAYLDKYHNKFKHNEFNKPFQLEIQPNKLTYLIFGHNFNLYNKNDCDN